MIDQPMIERRFSDLWGQLQGKKPHLPHFLAEIHLQGIRGIDDLRVVLDYPVSVIAGGNASGKSTVLFAAACAYRVPGAGVRDFVPSTLQQLALRNDLQIIVTTHSPVVLDSVPANGRIFLDRGESGRVTVQQAHVDVVQDALYGRSREVLNLLCEDDAAQAVVQGVLDHVVPKRRIRGDSVRIGRDTGADEFPAHAAAFRKFGQIANFVFILDGDQRGSGIDERIREQAGRAVPTLFLPGGEAPEAWVWERLRQAAVPMAAGLSVAPGDLANRLHRLDAVYDTASDRPAAIAKAKLRGLGEALSREAADICRTVARLEAERPESGLQPFAEGLETVLLQWRAG